MIKYILYYILYYDFFKKKKNRNAIIDISYMVDTLLLERWKENGRMNL